MSKLRTLIADDEPLARTKLRRLIGAERDLELCGEARSGDEAMRLICDLRPDLLFLDVQMPETDGLAVLRAVRDEWLPLTIFTTAHAEHAVAAFELHALDYLLKPYTEARFSAALQRVRSTAAKVREGNAKITQFVKSSVVTAGPPERLLVKCEKGYEVVRTSDILWAESASNYVKLHTARGGNHFLRGSLGMLEGELDPRQFFRASRAALVALNVIDRVEFVATGEHVLRLSNGHRVILTRGLRELQERLEARGEVGHGGLHS